MHTSSLLEWPCIFDDKLDFALTEGSIECLEEHSVVSEGASSCLCAKYSVVMGGLLPATIVMASPTN